MSHSRPSLRPLYRALLILLVLSLLAPPVSAAAQGWRLAPARPAEPVVAPLDTRVARASGETYDAFFMRVGQQDPQRLQLAALRALEYYLNNAAPGGAPADAFERMIERYLALPVAVLGSAEAHRRVAGPPAALQPVVRLPRPAAPAQAAAPVATTATAPAAAPSTAPAAAPDPKPAKEAVSGPAIEAPLNGTFYRSSGPGKPLFVEDGATVKAGVTICIVEAMKLFNEIKAPCDCRIIKALIEHGKPVKKGDALFAYEKIG